MTDVESLKNRSAVRRQSSDVPFSWTLVSSCRRVAFEQSRLAILAFDNRLLLLAIFQAVKRFCSAWRARVHTEVGNLSGFPKYSHYKVSDAKNVKRAK